MPDVLTTTALLLAQTPVSLSRSELRWERANVAAGVALVTSALAAIALFLFRRRTRDLTLIYFGLVCILSVVDFQVPQEAKETLVASSAT
jgi:uncharacterized membrane protein